LKIVYVAATKNKFDLVIRSNIKAAWSSQITLIGVADVNGLCDIGQVGSSKSTVNIAVNECPQIFFLF
jgi:hypothetical protein